jgi:hypothetical protein
VLTPAPQPLPVPQPVPQPAPQPVPLPAEPPSNMVEPANKGKPMTIVHEYVKGKIEHPRYNEMLEFLKDKEMDINENEITIKIYNLYMDLKRS